MTPPAQDDHRHSARAAMDFMVEIFETDGTTLLGIGRVLNLSLEGACVDSTSAVREKEDVVLRLLLGKQQLLTVPARVIWAKAFPHQWEYGLAFGKIPAESHAILSKFIAAYLGVADLLRPPPEEPPAPR